MPTYTVNLDALIPREYYEATTEANPNPTPQNTSMLIRELEQNTFTYPFLRKPEFQRETSDWDPAKVAELIQAFVEGDLIPAIILWRANNGNTFVIDGAHRLSSLIAWVHDDYGDRQISLPFFQNYVPEEQRQAADTTRHLVESTIGSYHDIQQAVKFPQTADPRKLRFAQNLGTGSVITLQWVPGNDASRAEQSYFKINQQASLIDKTELAMISARYKPHVLATRALIRAGTGHKYWSKFPPQVQDEIEKIAREVYETLFKPAIEEPLKTLDLPVGGRGYSPDSVKMAFDLVKALNRVPTKAELNDDADGSATITHLAAVQSAASLISGNEPRSLGLHPVVYFYGATGRFQPPAFLAVVQFAIELEEKNQLKNFTTVRRLFEDFLLKYRHFTNQIVRKQGAGPRGVPNLLVLYKTMLNALSAGEDDEGVLNQIRMQKELTALQEVSDYERSQGQDFSKGTKNAVFLANALDKALRCSICGARLHFKSITMDHTKPSRDGGLGVDTNAGMAHPYCNSGFKESGGVAR